MNAEQETITNVVVIGAPRSGTTLISALISSGQESSPFLPECSYITRLIQHYHETLNFSDPYRFKAYAINQDKLYKIFKNTIDAFIANARSHFLKKPFKYLILKDPELTLFTDLIIPFFGGQSKVVCVVRDPRSVTTSMKEVLRKKRVFAWNAYLKERTLKNARILGVTLLNEIEAGRELFNYYYRVHTSELFKQGNLHIVQYEKIINRDEDEFQKLEQFLGFQIGREGFGEIPFGMDRNDPTFSDNYEKKIQSPNSTYAQVLSKRKLKSIEIAYSGLNEKYNWW